MEAAEEGVALVSVPPVEPLCIATVDNGSYPVQTGPGAALARRGVVTVCSHRLDCAGWVVSLVVLHRRAVPTLPAGSLGPRSPGLGWKGARPRAGREGWGRE